MIVELKNVNEYWEIKDVNGVFWTTNLLVNNVQPEKANNGKSKIKEMIKLKEAGFTSDEILDLLKEL